VDLTAADLGQRLRDRSRALRRASRARRPDRHRRIRRRGRDGSARTLGRPGARRHLVAGLALSACLWWAYFGGDDERAERALRAAPFEGRPRLAVNAFGYCHLPILLGIIAVAAAVHEAIGQAFDELVMARSLTLAGGVAVYLVGDALFRHSLGIGRSRWRLACAVAAPLTIPLGTSIAAELQVAALVALLLGCFALEAAGERRTSTPLADAGPSRA
jgi:low temperature requirement protein LtrA